MKMTWDSEAEKMLRRVPFFVRKRVRMKVEEEVAAAGRNCVTKGDLEESKRKHLKSLSEGIKGYSLDVWLQWLSQCGSGFCRLGLQPG